MSEKNLEEVSFGFAENVTPSFDKQEPDVLLANWIKQIFKKSGLNLVLQDRYRCSSGKRESE